jgi:hypothetical protein
MISTNLGKNKPFRKLSLIVISLLVLIGVFLIIQAQKEAKNNVSSVKTALTQEERQKNAEHMAIVTNKICGRFDEALKEYSDNLDNISYNSKSTETIYNNFKIIQNYSKGTQQNAESIEIIDPRYEDIKTSLIQSELNIQLSAQHMMDYLNDPKSNTDWKAQNELVNAMQLNKSAKENIVMLTQEDNLKLSK